MPRQTERRWARGILLRKTLRSTVCSACMLAGAAQAATPLGSGDTDQPIWRAMHGLLLGIARAGDRLVVVGNEGAILLSDDSGQSWRAAQVPTRELLTGVWFASAQEGWAIGQDEIVLHSADGGQTWTQQHFAKAADQTLFSITAFAASHLVTVGAYNLILETTDGTHWSESKIPNLDDDYHLNCAAARGEDLIVTGEAGHAFIRHQASWTPVKLPYDGSQFACVVGKRGDFFSFGLRGSAWRLAPGETSWTQLNLGGAQSTFGATILSDSRIVLVGSSGMVRLIDPDTYKVRTLPPTTEAALSAVAEVKLGRILAVGADGIHAMDVDSSAADIAP